MCYRNEIDFMLIRDVELKIQKAKYVTKTLSVNRFFCLRDDRINQLNRFIQMLLDVFLDEKKKVIRKYIGLMERKIFHFIFHNFI